MNARSLLLAVSAVAVVVGGSIAHAADTAEIALTIEDHRFVPEELRVKAGAPFVIVITNKDTTVEEFESRALRIEKIVPAGKTLRLRMPSLKPGTYDVFGEYHEKTARGRIVAE